MAPRASKKPTRTKAPALDFDPESLSPAPSDAEHDGDSGSDSGSDDGNDADLARDHYVAVGKSALRRGQEPELLGKAYQGARVARDALNASDDDDSEGSEGESEGETGDESEGGVAFSDMEDADIVLGVGSGSDDDEEIDSDDAMGSGDEDRFGGYAFKGSRTTAGGRPKARGEAVAGDSDDSNSNSDNSDANSDNDSDESSNPDQSNASDSEDGSEDEESGDDSEDEARRAALSKILAAERTATASTLSTAAARDQAKGAAVRTQQHIHDGLLSSRIKFQKALGAVNSLSLLPPLPSLSASPSSPSSPSSATAAAAEAEKAALDLWRTLTALRRSLPHSTGAQKRAHSEISDTAELWSTMASLDAAAAPWRTAVLARWSDKTTPVATAPAGRKLAASQPRGLVESIGETIAGDMDRLVAKTRVARADPTLVGAKRELDIFDDTDLYQQQLKTLIASRTVDHASAASAAAALDLRRTAKRAKKVVDTRASKGRKMKYVVHEKLMNFMAPDEGVLGWREEQARELFGSLFGQRMGVEEEEDEGMDLDEAEVNLGETGGLRIFG
ncbi:apoptosis-antagonizing transcription factor [Geopyxis carbonaria]|nr:apoptosis-antagonizing transcription factor [Geopyxis carbonaria]